MVLPMDERMRIELLSGLNPAQAEAVTSTAAPLCILAGAGSGKTRVLTRRMAWRIAEGTADPARVLALTFTRKSAGELTKRLGQLGVRDRVAAGTFHSVAYAQLRQWWTDSGVRAPSLTESKIRLIAPLLGTRRASNVAPVDIASEIEWAKARLITPATYVTEVTALGRRPPLGIEAMADLYGRYEADKRRRGLVDFDDLLLLTVEAMEHDREFAARQRWRFRHLFVDEFQDVNPAQSRLLDGWLGLDPGRPPSSSAPVDLCVVGDPNQAIYAWNGADPRFLTGFRERFASGGMVRLEDNYRSSPQILTVADAVLGLGTRDSRPLRPNQNDGPLPVVTCYPSDIEEARSIARMVRERHNGRMPWKHLAVLTRTNAQLLLFEEAFRAAGIPHRVRGNGAFLALPEVRRALDVLRHSPVGSALSSRLRDLEELAAEATDAGGTGVEGTNDRADQIEGVVRLGHEFLGNEPHGTVATFLAWVSATITSRADEPDRGSDIVELSTFHRAKGLEWPVVFVAGLERGFVPIGQADDDDGRAEERRLLYVAVTRAERELHCSWAQQRTFGARTTARNASIWVANITAAVQSMDQGGGGDWRTVLRANRERLAAAKAAGVPGISGTKKAAIQVGAGADPEVYELLKAWRAQESRRSGLPAFVIFHDTALAAMAEARPSSIDGLLGLPGVGPVKAGRYGSAIIEVVAKAVAQAS